MTHRNRIATKLALGLSLAAGLVAITPAVTAQSQTRLQASIPFAFTANKVPLPAGTYIVQIDGQRFLSLRNVKTGKSQFVMVRPDSWTRNTGNSRLTFHHEAGQTYLTQVWIEGRDLHSDLITHPKLQREFAKLAPPASTFEIAMK